MTRIRVLSLALAATVLIPTAGRSASGESLQGVYLMKRTGGEADLVIPLDALPLHPALSPDTKHIAYMEVGAEQSAVVVADRRGSVIARFARSRFPGGEPVAWSPAGRRIAYFQVRTTQRVPYESIVFSTSAADGSGRRDLAKAPLWRIIPRGPTWSPDGRSVAWARERGEETLDVEVIAVRSGQRRLVASDLEDEFDPRWSPDGRLILFTRLGLDSDWETLWTVHPKTLEQRRVTRRYQGVTAAWSPDGSKIAFTGAAPGDDAARLFVIDRTGKHLRALATGLQYSRPAWSPEGRSIAFATESGIEVLAPDGSRRRKLVQFRETEIDDLAWSADGSLLIFLAEPPVDHD
ncbi:MAG TPA: hypothetical protein VFR32_09120 [Gaiellaceae bacterium]|nr:hypothetical protein [Gaiellaceae bacterium]